MKFCGNLLIIILSVEENFSFIYCLGDLQQQENYKLQLY